MLIRGALWKMHTEMGDGATTLGVIYQVLMNEGIRAVVQMGCNAMLLRSGFEKGLKAVRSALQKQVVPLEGKHSITQIALGMCQGDAEMAELIGEIFDIVGSDGMIVVEKWNRWGLEREYIEGTFWELSGYFSRTFISIPTERQVILEDAALLISDFKIKDPSMLVSVLEKCVKARIKRLVIIAAEVSDAVIGLLANNNRAKTIQTLAVRTPRIQEFDRVAVMQDVAVLTGGRIFYSMADPTFENFQAADLGQARRIWATESQFGLFGGKGDIRQIRQHLITIQGLLAGTDSKESFQKTELQKRIGRLLGGTAILRVGALTETATETRKELAIRAVAALRTAVREGVVAGGGAALLVAQSALRDLPGDNQDEIRAYKILARALEEPMRTIAQNSGHNPDVILDKVKSASPGFGLDARSGEIIEMRQCGIQDAAGILLKAVDIAVSSAALALTTDIIVHHAEPKETLEP
jgi:chaperonin GroEL